MERTEYYRIALLASTEASEFTTELLRGIDDALMQFKQQGGKDYHLCLFDGKMDRKSWASQDLENHIFNLIRKGDLDGIIVPCWLIGRFGQREDLLRFIQRLAPVPISIIGMDLAGYPSVVMDNYGGMFKITSHMINSHGMKRPLLLSGPADHGESLQRIEGFLDAMKDHELPFSRENLIEGDFSTLSGNKAVQLICNRDPGLESWDTLLCLNDNMAYGAINELQIRGYSVPEDLAVTGFDNADYAISVVPQITTLSYPAYENSRIATEELLAKIGGKKKIPTRTVRGNLIVRNSCGCGTDNSKSALRNNSMDQTFYGDNGDYLSPEQKKISNRLFQCLEKGVLEGNQSVFQKELNLLLQEFKLDSNRPFHLSIFNFIQERVKKEWTSSSFPDVKPMLNYLNQQIQELRISQERSRFIEYRMMQEHYHLLQEAISNSTDLSMVRKALIQNLEGIHMTHMYICRYYPGTPKDRLGELILAYKNSQEMDLSLWPLFNVNQLLPEGLWDHMGSGLTVLSPLDYFDQNLGYAIFHTRVSHFTATGWLSQQLVNALSHFDWVDELRGKNQFLEESLTALKKTREQLVESEKLAALGEMIGGIAHEVNGPIGVGITLSTHLKDYIQDSELFRNPASEEIRDIYDRVTQGLDLLHQNLDRAAGLIRNYKMVAVDQSSEQKREYEIHSYIREVIATMRSEWKHHRINFFVEGCENLILDGFPGMVSQIINHLVINSLHHGFPGNKGNIRISLTLKESRIVIDYKDDGVGIPRENLSRIFDPLYTTARSSGRSGLGLYVVYTIITRHLEGQIHIREPEKGVWIEIEYPVVVVGYKPDMEDS